MALVMAAMAASGMVALLLARRGLADRIVEEG